MQIGRDALKTQLLNSVAEIRFFRRRPVAGKSASRRMLCTNSATLLNSYNGKMVLNYQAPIFTPKFDPNNNNIIITWDILMQNYRCINMDGCDLIQTWSDNDEFWKYFNESILPMTTQQKMQFMDT
jgi:hypothetical protein